MPSCLCRRGRLIGRPQPKQWRVVTRARNVIGGALYSRISRALATPRWRFLGQGGFRRTTCGSCGSSSRNTRSPSFLNRLFKKCDEHGHLFREQAVPDEAGDEFLSRFVREMLASIPWGHHVELLKKIKNPNARLWYLQATARLGWSRNVLLNQIKAGAYERGATEKKTHNFALALPEHLAEQADEKFARFWWVEKEVHRMDFSEKPFEIFVPKLTPRERYALDAAMPCPDGWQHSKFKLPEEWIEAYRRDLSFFASLCRVTLLNWPFIKPH